MSHKRIVIIGGGLSGSLLALALARKNAGHTIILLEKNPGLPGRGVAYHHDFTLQPLNVVAAGMSLFADQPDDFVSWLRQNHFRYRHLLPEVSPQSFAPRKIFGDYVVEHLERLQHEAAGHFQIRIDEALSVKKENGKNKVSLESGVVIEADEVVLALGNFPPGDLFEGNEVVNKDNRYFPNPWTDRIYSQLEGNENILLVGTGLTAVDVVLGLHMRGFEGKITMLSRRGRLPLPHDLSHPALRIEEPFLGSPRDTFLWLRRLIRENKNVPWVAVIEGLRPHTQRIWRNWSTEEKRYFLRRLRPFWEVVRHRIPAASSELLDRLVRNGQLTITRGNVQSASVVEGGIGVGFSSEGKMQHAVFQKVINCTGPESNYRKVRFPIILDLMNQGKVTTDELGLGILCTAEGKLLNEKGQEEAGLWCIGPMRKAILWETTALRELREQAVGLSELL